MAQANVVHAPAIGDWNHVEKVIVDGKELRYVEYRDATFNISLLFNTMDLESSGVKWTVPFLAKEFCNITYEKAILLINASKQLPLLANNHLFTIKQRKTSGNDGGVGGDSDDEMEPNLRVEPPFTVGGSTVLFR